LISKTLLTYALNHANLLLTLAHVFTNKNHKTFIIRAILFNKIIITWDLN